MIADLWVYELGDAVLLSMARDVGANVLAKLDQFIFSEDVQLGDVTESFDQIAVLGPAAGDVLSRAIPSLSRSVLDALPLHGNVRAERDGAAVIVTRIEDAGEPGFDVYIERRGAEPLRAALRADDVPALDENDAEALRIERGVPRFHRDMDEETIPLEAGIESRAISFNKGCYVGQEVIIRVLHRGHGRVARKLVGLRVDGAAVPTAGAAIKAGDRDAGAVTSAAYSPSLQQPIALGYVHRDFVEPGTSVTVGGVAATVSALPFV
jgi:folate-binding protein YgfZ